MKLELKHLAPYLPYGLKLHTNIVHSSQHFGNSKIYGTLDYENCSEIFKRITNKNYDIDNGFSDSDDIFIKPILRPLSDLAKDEFKDIVFPKNDFLEKGREENRCFSVGMVQLQSKTNQSVSYFSIVERLLELHFDIYDLIEKGLAIDVNTLK